MWRSTLKVNGRSHRLGRARGIMAVVVAFAALATPAAAPAADAPRRPNIVIILGDDLLNDNLGLTLSYKSTTKDAADDLQMDVFMISLVSGWHPIIEGAKRLKQE